MKNFDVDKFNNIFLENIFLPVVKKNQKNKNMKKQSYDLIGDIHGQAPELLRLLEKLSYRKINGRYYDLSNTNG